MRPLPSPPPRLLEPTLSASAPTVPLLSPGATFLTSFFGGPWAALAVAAVNAARLRRLRREVVPLAAAALLGMAALALTAAALLRPETVASWVPWNVRASSLVRRIDDALGIAVWVMFRVRFASELRAGQLLGWAKPWKPCLAALAGAVLLHGATVLVAAGLR